VTLLETSSARLYGPAKVPAWREIYKDVLRSVGTGQVVTATRRLALGLAGMLTVLAAPLASQGANQVETIVIFRHGEKPAGDALGQLTCQGLNRALALPTTAVLKKYGPPAALFAPNPSVQIMDGNYGPFSYVRPLATIEPTAIALGMPVNTQIGYTALGALQSAVTASAYASSSIFVAWEHGHIPQLAKNLLSSYGADPSQVPGWADNDYDTVFIVQITTPSSGSPTATFTVGSEGMPCTKGAPCPSATCPSPASSSR
jgi:hypothetical protein